MLAGGRNGAVMNLERVDQIAKAVLYEGYMLYPYRPSSVKNQQRWNFGVLYPQAYSEAQGGTEACSMRTECLVRGQTRAQARSETALSSIATALDAATQTKPK